MLVKTLGAAALAVALAAPVAPAAADPFTYQCTWVVQIPSPTGQNTHLAYVVGTVQHGLDPATIRCYVKVNGAVEATTAAGVGGTAGWVTYAANTPPDVVELCAEATTSHGVVVTCI